MSAGRAQKVLVQHLVDPESIRVMAQDGVPETIIPDETLRAIYIWAMDYYRRNGMRQAPSIEAMNEEWGDQLSDAEVAIEEEPLDTVEWAIDTLKSHYVFLQSQEFTKEFARDISENTHARVEVVGHYASRLVRLSTDMERRAQKSDLREDMVMRLHAYGERKADQGAFYGMRTGLPEVDRHTNGIHPGELAILAAGPKVGKSYFLDHAAIRDWEAGNAPIIFTLENAVEMTTDRIICLMARVDSRAFQRGLCTPDEELRVQQAIERIQTSDVPFYIFQPDLGHRSFEHMIAEALVRDVDSVYIDQLTFVELSDADDRRPRTERIGDALHRLKVMISTGRKRLPVMLAHQINREGVKAADKNGYLEMFHLAESAEVERTADWVFGLYASHDDRIAQRVKMQTLASRREAITNWNLTWNVGVGNIRVRDEFAIAS